MPNISQPRLPPSWRILAALVLLGASFPLAQWQEGTSRLSREPNGHYASLTEAFLDGQLHLKQSPDPRLVALANPYAGEQGVPRPWDVSYYNQRFYLYFGPPPVFLLFAPVRLLTGFYLPDGMGTACFGLVGFGCGAWFLLRQRARLFPAVGEPWVLAGLAVWALASHAQLLAHSDAVYPVPINAAFACLAAAVACGTLAWENPGNLRWLFLTGLAWGLAIACRPNYLFSLGGLMVFVLGVLRRNREQPPEARRSPRAVLAAAGLPVLLIGAALATYNWARFQNITEFGTSYMLMAGDQRHRPLLQWDLVATGLRNTLLLPVDYSPYFPFAAPLGRGMLLASPVLLLVLGLPWLWFSSRSGERLFWRISGTALLLAAAGNLLTVALLQTQEYRYNVDYLATAVLLAVLIGWSLAQALAGSARHRARTARLALGLAFGITLFHAGAANLAFFNLPRHAPALSRWLNQPAHWLETALGRRHGPLRLSGKLPALPPGTVLPLVVTGRGSDLLYVRYTGPDLVQFGFFHAGDGGPESLPFPLDLTQAHVVEIDLGSLYPPPEHPLFAGWSPHEVRIIRQRVRVTVDGRSALEGSSNFYPTHPWDVRVGKNPKGLVAAAARWDLPGLQVERLGLPARLAAAAHPLKPVRLELTFPPFVHFKREPLVSTGRPGAGDLFYVTYVGPNQLRFAHDSMGSGSIESGVIDYVPGRIYSLEVDMGSLRPRPAGTGQPGLLRVQLDGEPVMVTPRFFHASEAIDLAFGYNSSGSSATYPVFTGQIRKITPLETLPDPSPAYGPLRCIVRFPADRIHRAEPLVVTGRAGAGDFIYVVYSGDDTIRVGYDHWGTGGPLSEPIPLDYREAHQLEVSLGSLLPPSGDDAAWTGLDPAGRRRLAETVTVRLDGRVVLDHRSVPHPARPDEVGIGTNPIGGSTCDPLFTGRILHVERMVPGPLPAPAGN